MVDDVVVQEVAKRKVIETNVSVRMSFTFNKANYLCEFNSHANLYLRHNIMMLLAMPEVVKQLKERYGEDKYKKVMKKILFGQADIEHQIALFQEAHSKLSTEQKGQQFVRDWCERRIPKLCSQIRVIEPSLLQCHTLLEFYTDLGGYPVARNIILEARQNKLNFKYDDRASVLNLQKAKASEEDFEGD